MSENVFVPYIGMRVRISGSNIKWAEGMTGVIRNIHLNEVPYKDIDPYITNPKITVLLDDMDKSKPPYGLLTVSSHEIEPLPDPSKEKENDPVNHPNHYTDGEFEVIDYIESYGYNANFYLGNAVKYLSRAGKKSTDTKREDIDKAIWYLNRYLEWKNRRSSTCVSIGTDAYIKDKGLENTPQGVALAMIAENKIDLAIKVLNMK